MTTPQGMHTATTRLSRSRLALRGDHTARFRTRCYVCTSDAALRPMIWSTAVTVRWPGARTAPVLRTFTCGQTGGEKTGAKTPMTLVHVLGKESLAILSG